MRLFFRIITIEDVWRLCYRQFVERLYQPRPRNTPCIYCCLRRSTERNEDRIRTLHSRTVNGRIFLRMLSHIFVNDTEIYDRNTEPGISSYYFVYGRIRPWLFDLGNVFHQIFVWKKMIQLLSRLFSLVGSIQNHPVLFGIRMTRTPTKTLHA